MNAAVGTLFTSDVDSSSFTYSLTPGAGDNTFFNISGNSLRANGSFDHETKSSYNVVVQTSDGSNTYSKTISVSVSNVNEAPTNIALSSNSIAENAGANATVGTFSTTDVDSSSFIYSLIPGSGDNASFNISGNSLRANASLNYATKSSYSLRVQTSDGVNIYQKTVTVSVISPVYGECIMQDTYRGGGVYPNKTRTECVSMCITFRDTKHPSAYLYDCRWYSNGVDEVVLPR